MSDEKSKENLEKEEDPSEPKEASSRQEQKEEVDPLEGPSSAFDKETGKPKRFFGNLFARNKSSEQVPISEEKKSESEIPIKSEESENVEPTDEEGLVKQEIALKGAEENEEPKKKKKEKKKHKHKKLKEQKQRIQFEQPTSDSSVEEKNKGLTDEEIFNQKLKKFNEMYKNHSTSKQPKMKTPTKLTFHDHYITKKLEMMKWRKKKRHEPKVSNLQTKKTALWILFVFIQAISESSTWIFASTLLSFISDEMIVEDETAPHLATILQGLCNILTAYIADSYLKRFLTVIYFGFVTLATYFGLALLVSIQDYLNSTFTWIYLATIFFLNLIGSSVFAANMFLVLDQTQTLKQIRRSCILSIWLKHLFLLILEVLAMIFYREKKFPLMISFVGVGSHIFLITAMIVFAPRVQSHYFEKYSVESLLVHTCTYSKLKRKNQIEEVQETKQFYNVLYTLAPFFLYFFIAKFISMPWTMTRKGYTGIEKQLTRSSVALIIHGISVVTIPLLEYLIFPLFTKTKFDDLKYFGIGVILLGVSFILSFIVFIHLEKTYVGPPKPKTANLLFINGMDTTVKIKGDILKENAYFSLRPLSAVPVPVIQVNEKATDRLSVEVKDKNIKYWKRIFLHELKTTIFVVSKGYRLIRVRGFKSDLTEDETYYHLSKVVFYTTHMTDELNITFNLIEADSDVLKERNRSMPTKNKKKFLEELSKSQVKIPTPMYGDQSSVAMEAGKYQIKVKNASMNVTLKSRRLHHFLIHGQNATLTEIKTKEINEISSFWDLPTIFFHTLSYNTIMVSYICYIYVHSPVNLKTISLAILSFDLHLVPCAFLVYHAMKFVLSTQIYVVCSILYMLDLLLFIFITVKYRLIDYLRK